MPLTDTIAYYIKSPGPIDLPKQYGILPLLLVILHNLTIKLYCYIYHMYFSHRTWRDQVATDLEASFLLASFYSSRRYYICYQQRKMISVLHSCEPGELE